MLEITKTNFEKEVLKSEKIVVVDFWAEWCGPCLAMAPIFEELSKEMKTIKFAKLNVDEEGEIAGEYQVMSIPTFIIFKNGKEILRQVGGMPKEMLKKKIAGIM